MGKGVWACAVINLGICAVIGFTVYWMNSAWPVFGLIFLTSYKGNE